MISPSSSKWLMWFGICFYYIFGMWGAGIRLRIFLLNNGTLALADYKLYHPPACYTYSLSSIYNRLLSYLSWSYIINYNSLPLHMVFSRTVLSAPYFRSDRIFNQKKIFGALVVGQIMCHNFTDACAPMTCCPVRFPHSSRCIGSSTAANNLLKLLTLPCSFYWLFQLSAK